MATGYRVMFTRSAVGYGVGLYRPDDGRPVDFRERRSDFTLVLSYSGIMRRVEGLTYEDAAHEADNFMAACHAWQVCKNRAAALAAGYSVIGG